MYEYTDITGLIISAAFKVHSALGPGFLEKVYENAMVWELQRLGLNVKQQASISVFYEGQTVGEYFADIYVEDKVIVELKAAGEVSPMAELQCYNYLRASGVKVGLVLAFGARKVVICRVDL